ncbi:hypothetical protein J14TS5_12750 [Paenibacillus lautus]|uniref:hypothetical protein n=1 Tax=Paenibacillus lautus TaxID=1401 RepID=UPI001B2276BE|nr:hypothetical protein [Paenibacillus lautus]GIO96189.1 hypothetical protein J14TS5_12750 [Paenibacillus lautus]
MMRKRIVMESVLFAAAIYIGYFVFMILQSLVLTQRQVRNLDLTRQYERAESLHAQVAFGMIERNSEWLTVAAIGGFILLGSLYGCVRWMLAKRRPQS